MNKLLSIGEALIDFIPIDVGVKLKDVSGFIKSPGGAPANVAACVKKLGGNAQLITKLGCDAFGDFLEEKIRSVGVDTSSVLRTDIANTALAFLSLQANGEREFSFYRKPSADMLLEASDIKAEWFDEGDILHFCSVDLIDAPVRYAHDEAIRIAKEKNIIVSFDVNVRLSLWEDHKEYQKVISHYIEKSDVLKISDEELAFVTGIADEQQALDLLKSKVSFLVYTKGADGAYVYANNQTGYHKGYSVKVVDTTGAGDSFIGAILFQLLNQKNKAEWSSQELTKMIAFANAVGALVVSQKGAIDVMPTVEQVEKMMSEA